MRRLTSATLLLAALGILSANAIPAAEAPDKNSKTGIVPVTTNLSPVTEKKAGKPAKFWIKENTHYGKTQTKGKVVEVSYPTFSGAPLGAVEQLNSLMRMMVNVNMPTGVANTNKEFSDSDYSYNCSYTLVNLEPRLVSVLMEFSSYEGGAHGNGTVMPFNYQIIPTGLRHLTLENIFGQKPDFQRLQKLVRAELVKTILTDEVKAGMDSEQQEGVIDWINKGTAKMSDFDCVTFDKDEITFKFQSYQVACYADGRPEVSFTYGQLRPLFTPLSPLYKFVLASKDKALPELASR